MGLHHMNSQSLPGHKTAAWPLIVVLKNSSTERSSDGIQIAVPKETHTRLPCPSLPACHNCCIQRNHRITVDNSTRPKQALVAIRSLSVLRAETPSSPALLQDVLHAVPNSRTRGTYRRQWDVRPPAPPAHRRWPNRYASVPVPDYLYLRASYAAQSGVLYQQLGR